MTPAEIKQRRLDRTEKHRKRSQDDNAERMSGMLLDYAQQAQRQQFIAMSMRDAADNSFGGAQSSGGFGSLLGCLGQAAMAHSQPMYHGREKAQSRDLCGPPGGIIRLGGSNPTSLANIPKPEILSTERPKIEPEIKRSFINNLYFKLAWVIYKVWFKK